MRDLSSKASSVICQRLPVGGHRSLGLACDWFCCQRMSARNVLLRLALPFFSFFPFSLSPFWAFVQFFVAVSLCEIVISPKLLARRKAQPTNHLLSVSHLSTSLSFTCLPSAFMHRWNVTFKCCKLDIYTQRTCMNAQFLAVHKASMCGGSKSQQVVQHACSLHVVFMSHLYSEE